jgi:hypothetical protein
MRQQDSVFFSDPARECFGEFLRMTEGNISGITTYQQSQDPLERRRRETPKTCSIPEGVP